MKRLKKIAFLLRLLGPELLSRQVMAQQSQCFPDTNQPQILASQSDLDQGDSTFTAVTMNKAATFVVSGGYTRDQKLWPVNYPAPGPPDNDYATVLMRTDVEPTFTRWIKAYSAIYSGKKSFISGLAISDNDVAIFVAVKYGDVVQHQFGSRGNLIFTVNSQDGTIWSQIKSFNHADAGNNRRYGLKSASIVAAPDNKTVFFGFTTCDQSIDSVCEGDTFDGSPYALRFRYGSATWSWSKTISIKEITSHFGSAASIAISPRNLFTGDDNARVYIGGTIDTAQRTVTSDTKKWAPFILVIKQNNAQTILQRVTLKIDAYASDEKRASVLYFLNFYEDSANSENWLYGLSHKKSQNEIGVSTFFFKLKLDSASGTIVPQVLPTDPATPVPHIAEKFILPDDERVVGAQKMEHDYYFVSHRQQNGGNFILNKRSESDSTWGREELYRPIGSIRETFMPQQPAFDATTLGSSLSSIAKVWLAGFSTSLDFQDNTNPLSPLTRSTEIGYVTPNTLENSCIKREFHLSALTVDDKSSVLEVTEIAAADMTIANCASCDQWHSDLKVADLQIDKMYSMKDMCTPNTFQSVISISEPVIPDVCPVILDGKLKTLAITLPQITDPASCSSDPSKIWLPYLKPISPADYDPALMQANINADKNELKYIIYEDADKTHQDVTFQANFRLPDGTEKTKEFTIHATQTCELKDVGKPKYDNLKEFDISSLASFEYEIPLLTVPEGCSFTYSVSSIVSQDATVDGSFLMTKQARGISWGANTPFTADHVGRYVVTVVSHPEACTLDSRTFTIELIRCKADILEIDTADTVFKSTEKPPALSYLMYEGEPEKLNWGPSVLSSNNAYPLCQEVEMEIVMPDDSKMPEPFEFTYDIKTRSGTLTVETLNENLIGFRELKAVAWYQTYPTVKTEKIFIIEIVYSCNPLFKVTKWPQPNYNLSYQVGKPEQFTSFGFSYLPTICRNFRSEIESVPYTEAISLSRSGTQVAIYTDDQADAFGGTPSIAPADYTVTVWLRTNEGGPAYKQQTEMHTFTVTIERDPCRDPDPDPNHPDCFKPVDYDTGEFHIKLRPYFKGSISAEYFVPIGNNWVWFVPELAHEDIENEHTYTLSYSIDIKADFLQFNSKARMFSIVEGSTSVVDQGLYTITLKLKDELGVENSPKFQLKLKIVSIDSLIGQEQVKKEEEEQEIEQIAATKFNAEQASAMLQYKRTLKRRYAKLEPDEPLVEMSQVSTQGTLVLKFTNKMIRPEDIETEEDSEGRLLKSQEDYDYLKKDNVIEVALVRDEDDDDDNASQKSFNWEIASYSQQEMEIKITFDQPLLVSEGGQKDSLNITFVNTELLFDVFGQEILPGTTINRLIPPQFASRSEAEVFNSLSESVGTIETGFFATNVFLNAFIALILQSIWSMLESQQIIVLFPLFTIILPANVQSVFAVLLQIAAFDAIPTEEIFETMLDSLESETKGQNEAVIEKFEGLGFDSIWFSPNLGSAIVFLIVYPLLLIAYPLIKSLSKRITSCHNKKRAIKGQLNWQMPIGFVKSNYIVIVIIALLNIFYGVWGNGAARFNLTLAWITLTFLAIFPIGIQCFLLKRRNELKKKSFKNKFGVAYQDLDEKEQKFFAYPLVFYYRRLILPTVLMIFKDSLTTQFMAMILLGLVSMILIGVQKPFKHSNVAEMGHEVVIILIMYHMFCFTEFVPDPKVRSWIGYSVILITALHLFVFYFLTLRKKVRGFLRERKNKSIMSKSRTNVQHREMKNAIKAHNRERRELLALQKAQGSSSQSDDSDSSSNSSSGSNSSSYTSSSESSSSGSESESQSERQAPPLESAVVERKDEPEIHENIELRINRISLAMNKTKTEPLPCVEEEVDETPIVLVDPRLLPSKTQQLSQARIANVTSGRENSNGSSVFSQVVEELVGSSAGDSDKNVDDVKHSAQEPDNEDELMQNDEVDLMFGINSNEKSSSKLPEQQNQRSRQEMSELEETKLPQQISLISSINPHADSSFISNSNTQPAQKARETESNQVMPFAVDEILSGQQQPRESMFDRVRKRHKFLRQTKGLFN